MKKRTIVLILTLLLVVSAIFAGCQKDAKPTDDAKPVKDDKGTDQKDAKDETPAEEPVELVWFMGGNPQNDQEVVEEVLNKITLEKLNATVKTIIKDGETIKLAMQSGEPFDMTFTCAWYNTYSDQALAGYFADITEKIETVTPELYATMPEVVWEGAKINGKLMAIPVKKDYAAEIFYRFDKALFVDELGMEIPEKMNYEDIEEYLKAAKDAWAAGNEAAAQAEFPMQLTWVGMGATSHFDMINADTGVGIPYSAVGTDDENKVVLSYEHEDALARYRLLHKWFKAGYINQDAATLEEGPKYSAVKSGQGFYGADAIWSGGDGYTQLISKYSGPYLSTSSIRGAMNAISANSEHIDLALQFQEIVNTNVDYRDILRYGVEGTHWNRTDEGLVQRTQVGRDNYGPWPFSQGSYSLSTVEAAEGLDVDPNMWKVIFDGYSEAVATNTIGFSFDRTPVEAQVAACQNVKEKYIHGLETGAVDPDVEIPKMVAELEAAGVRDIIAEAQKQLDAFLG